MKFSKCMQCSTAGIVLYITVYNNVSYYHYYLKRLAMQGLQSEINALSVRRPQPPTPIQRRKGEKGKTVKVKNEHAARPI